MVTIGEIMGMDLYPMTILLYMLVKDGVLKLTLKTISFKLLYG